MSTKTMTGPDRYRPTVTIRNKQCLCCKRIIWQYHAAYAARENDSPSWICRTCYRHWTERPTYLMFELPRYREQGRIKGIGNDPLRGKKLHLDKI